MDFQSSDNTLKLESQELLDAATIQVYRHNAFRVMQLPVDATTKQFSRQVEKIKLMEKYGSQRDASGGILPLAPPPMVEEMGEAIRRINDPVLRLVDEFFWFWPDQSGQTNSDEAIKLLAQGKIDEGAGIWLQKEREGSESLVSSHNLAVLWHAQALDQEWDLLNGHVKDASPNNSEFWEKAFNRWRLLLDNSAFWSRLTSRIKELEDPRLTTGTSRRFRASLPTALLRINAGLIVEHCEKKNWDHARRLKRQMTRSGFSDEAFSTALGKASAPVRERIKTLCGSATTEASADPAHSNKVLARLMERCGDIFETLDTLLPENNSTRQSARDEVALCVLSNLVHFANKTEDWETALDLSNKALEAAATESAKTRIKENIETLSKNISSGSGWCGKGYYDQPKIVVDALEKARGLMGANQFDPALRILAELIQGIGSVVVDESGVPLVRQAVAACLNQKGVHVHHEAVNVSNKAVPTLQKLLENVTKSLAGGSLKCMACLTPIYDQYIKFDFKNIPLIACPRCGNRIEQEQADRKKKINTLLEEAGMYFQAAVFYSPGNNQYITNRDKIAKEARESGTYIPPSLDLIIRLGLATVPDLLHIIRTGSSTDKEKARLKLMSLPAGSQRTVLDLIVAANTDPDSDVRKYAKKALVHMAPNWQQSTYVHLAVPRLVLALDDQDSTVREAAVETLGKIGAPSIEAVPKLITMSLTDPYLDVKKAASKALLIIDPNWTRTEAAHKAIPLLIMALLDSDSRVSEAAAKALADIDPNWTNRDEIDEILPKILDRLNSNVIDKQLSAVLLLGMIGPKAKSAVEKLLDLFMDGSSLLFEKTIWALSKIYPDWQALPATATMVYKIAKKLQDPAPETVLKALRVLSLLGPGAQSSTSEVIISCLAHSDDDVRKQAKLFLENIGGDWRKSPAAKTAMSDLLDKLLDPIELDKNPALEALNTINPHWARTKMTIGRLPLFIQALHHSETEIKRVAIQILGQMEQDAIEAIPDLLTLSFISEDRILSMTAEEALDNIDPFWRETNAAKSIIPNLIKYLVHENRDYHFRALEALENIDAQWYRTTQAQESLPFILLNLEKTSFPIRLLAIMALGEFRETAAAHVPKLVQELLEGDEETSQAASSSLEKIDPNWRNSQTVKDAVPDILPQIASDNDQTRQRAADLLDRIVPNWRELPHTARLVQKLIEDLTGASKVRRLAAIKALGVIGPAAAKAVPKLAEILQTENPQLRIVAAKTLGLIRVSDEQVIVALINCLHSQNNDVQTAASDTLGEFGSNASMAISILIPLMMSQYFSLRKSAENALSRIDPEWENNPETPKAITSLISISNKGDLADRLRGISLMGRIGPNAQKTISWLVPFLADQDHKIKKATAMALKRIHLQWWTTPEAKEAVPNLLPLVKKGQKSNRKAAFDALLKVEPARARSIRNRKIFTRVAAVAAGIAFLFTMFAVVFLALNKETVTYLSYRSNFISRSEALSKLLEQSDKEKWGFKTTAIKLKSVDVSITPTVAAGILSDDQDIRKNVIQTFQEKPVSIPDDLQFRYCLIAMNSPDKSVTEQAQKKIDQYLSGVKTVPPLLINDLLTGSADSRRFSAIALGSLGSKAQPALPFLTQCLLDPSELVQDAAVWAIKKINQEWAYEYATPFLIQHLGDGDENTRKVKSHLLFLLLKHYDDVHPALVDALKSPSSFTKITSIKAIGKKGKSAQHFIPDLISCMTDDDKYVRLDLIEALAEIDLNWLRNPISKHAVPTLINGLVNKSFQVRWDAEKTLGAIEPYWYKTSAAKSELPNMALALSSFHNGENNAALKWINLIDPRWKRSSYIRKAIPGLVVALGTESGVNNAFAEAMLTQISPQWHNSTEAKKAVSSLIPALASNDNILQKQVTEVLSKINKNWQKSSQARDAIPLLIMTSVQVNKYRVQKNIDAVLNNIDLNWAASSEAGTTVEFLLTSLLDPNLSVAKNSLKLLEKIDPTWSDSTTVQNLIPMFTAVALGYFEEEIKNRAQGVLHDINPQWKTTENILRALEKCRLNKDPEIRKAATRAYLTLDFNDSEVEKGLRGFENDDDIIARLIAQKGLYLIRNNAYFQDVPGT